MLCTKKFASVFGNEVRCFCLLLYQLCLYRHLPNTHTLTHYRHLKSLLRWAVSASISTLHMGFICYACTANRMPSIYPGGRSCLWRNTAHTQSYTYTHAQPPTQKYCQNASRKKLYTTHPVGDIHIRLWAIHRRFPVAAGAPPAAAPPAYALLLWLCFEAKLHYGLSVCVYVSGHVCFSQSKNDAENGSNI